MPTYWIFGVVTNPPLSPHQSSAWACFPGRCPNTHSSTNLLPGKADTHTLTLLREWRKGSMALMVMKLKTPITLVDGYYTPAHLILAMSHRFGYMVLVT